MTEDSSDQDEAFWTDDHGGRWRKRPPHETGLRGRCPRCGEAPAFNGYLSVRDHCSHCGENLGSYRADDAPPYFTIFLVGHIVIPLMLWVEKAWAPDIWVHAALWVPLSLVLTLATLPYIKGAVLGLMLQLRIH